MPKYTSFDIEFDAEDKPIMLYCVISPDNQKQQGEGFLEFVRLINKKADEIAKVIIVDASYLNRHYKIKYADHKNERMLFEWREANKKLIEQIKVPYAVISEFNLVSDEQFSSTFEQIKRLFEDGSDEEFRTIILELAHQFTHKGTIKQCIQYLLEECAIALLIEGYLTYPGPLNKAIQHIMKTFHRGPKFVPYTLVMPEIHHEEQTAPRASSSKAIVQPAPTKLPFFNQATTFPNRMSFQKENHVWKAECEILFFDENKDSAIATLLANIEEARNDYMKVREKLSHPIILEYKKHFTGYMISYKIEIKHSGVLETVNPFDVLTDATKIGSKTNEPISQERTIPRS